MKLAKLDYVSDHLVAMRHMFADARHGGVVLTSEDAEAFVGKLDEVIEISRNLENAYSQAEWNRRAGVDVRLLLNDQTHQILDAMRPSGNIVALRPPANPN